MLTESIERYVRRTQHTNLQFTFQSLLKTHANVLKHEEKKNANASLEFSGISASRAKFSTDENKPFYCNSPAQNIPYNILNRGLTKGLHRHFKKWVERSCIILSTLQRFFQDQF